MKKGRERTGTEKRRRKKRRLEEEKNRETRVGEKQRETTQEGRNDLHGEEIF